MPRGDGTGPRGRGVATGKRLGPCSGVNGVNSGLGFDRGMGLGGRSEAAQGFAGNYLAGQNPAKSEREQLLEQKNLLQNRLEAIEKQLEKL